MITFLQNMKMPELGAEGVINAVNARLEEDKADLMKAAIDVSEKQKKTRKSTHRCARLSA